VRLTVLLLSAALIALGSFSNDIAAQEWSAERKFVIAEPTGHGSFWGSISGIAVGHKTIYVLDRQERRLYAIGDSGEVLWSVGRAGSGPGEFSSVSVAVVLTEAGELAVPDLGNGRIAVFDTTGRFERSHAFTASGGSPLEWFALGNHLVFGLHPFPNASLTATGTGGSNKRTYIVRTLSGADEDTLLSTPFSPPMLIGQEGNMTVRMGPPPPSAASDGRNLYVASPDVYEIGVFDQHGNRTRTIRRVVRAVAVPAEQRVTMERQAEDLKRQVERQSASRPSRVTFEYPSHLPAVTRLVAGDGILIVRRGDTGTQDGKWVHDIFRDGEYAGFIGLPSNVTVHAVTAELIIAVEKDEYDVPSLLVLSLKPPSTR